MTAINAESYELPGSSVLWNSLAIAQDLLHCHCGLVLAMALIFLRMLFINVLLIKLRPRILL